MWHSFHFVNGILLFAEITLLKPHQTDFSIQWGFYVIFL